MEVARTLCELFTDVHFRIMSGPSWPGLPNECRGRPWPPRTFCCFCMRTLTCHTMRDKWWNRPWMISSVSVAGLMYGLPSDTGYAWMVSRLMNLRSRLSGISTGDQTIFVRRSVFEQMGGFADIPLMEDIEFSRRLKRLGTIAALRDTVTTSFRRWEQHGPFERSCACGSFACCIGWDGILVVFNITYDTVR